MALVEVPVRQLHQGVSRQPDHVRLVGQLQDANNLIFRVEEAGFTKRFGSQHVGVVEPPPAIGTNLAFHVIDLNAGEKYGITVHGGTCHIINLIDGTTPTVTIDPISATYLGSVDGANYAFTSILDYTFIVNRSVQVAMKSDLSPAGVNAVVFQVKAGRAGVYSITVDGHTGSHTTSTTDASQWDTSQIAQALVTALGSITGYTIQRSYGSYIIVNRTDNAIISASASDPAGGNDILTTNSGTPIRSTDLLPAYALDGMEATIGAAADNGVPNFYMKFVASPAGAETGYWTETIKPGIQYKLDPATMPQLLIRNSDGTFTLQPGTWGDRTVGDTTTVPDPDFVGKAINDIAVFRDRLDLLSGEHHWFSATSEYFRFFPKFSTLELDNDPFGIRGSSGRVNIQRFTLPYRKILFSTSDNTQFELTSTDVFTPKKAVMDESTTYVANSLCRPVTMAQMLYFPSSNAGDAVLLEYSFNYLTLTALANEVTKHVRGYVKTDIVDMTADQPTGNLFLLSNADRSKLYLWTVYWDGQERLQSCWSTWTFSDSTIYGARVSSGYLYMLVRHSDAVCIERIPLADGISGFPYAPRLDRQVQVSGSGDGTNTTYTLPFEADRVNTVVFKSGRKGTIVSTSGDTIVVKGSSVDMSPAMFGSTYDSSAVLSKQYHRDEKGTAILNGKLRLTQFTIAHKDTGYYEVHVDQAGRDENVWTFTGRRLGTSTDLIGVPCIDTGKFQKGGVEADGEAATITISNDTHLPHSISEILFRGIFNETVRQG